MLIQHLYYSCFWDDQSRSCKFLSVCQGISYQQCLSEPLCIYQNLNGCRNKVCNDYPTKYVQNFEGEQTLQSCVWVNHSCQNMSSSYKYDPETCFANTDQTSRWSSNNNSGYCIYCLPTFYQIKPQNQCICSQLLNQYECQKAGCNWHQNYCETQCTNIIQQTMCISTVGCYWNLDFNHCQELQLDFVSDICQSLKGQNSLECYSINFRMSSFTQWSLLNYNNLKTCQNSIGQEGYCNYENQQCQVLSSCTQIQYQHCNLMYKTCQWISGTCSKSFCSSYLSSADCDYVYQSVNSRVIQLCQWNQTQNVCEPNYYTSTGGLYHWSSNNLQNGKCVTCSINLIQPQKKCACTVLSEIECSLANPQCIWTSNSCVQSECTSIYDSINCSKQLKCMWSNGFCIDFSNCNDLQGSNSFECLAQLSQCGSSASTICQSSSSLQTCDKQCYTISTCIFGVKCSDGFCIWNNQSSTCKLLQSFNQIIVPTQCQSLLNTCKWSTYFNNCVPFECQDYQNEASFTHVNVNLQNTGVELCEWQNEVCQPYDERYFRFDQENCFQNSEQTYRWVSDNKRGEHCEQCSHSIIFMSLFIPLLVQVWF